MRYRAIPAIVVPAASPVRMRCCNSSIGPRPSLSGPGYYTSDPGALHTCREAMAEHGVEYAGRRRHSRQAAVGIAYATPPEGYSDNLEVKWKKLAAKVRNSSAERIIISSELLARTSQTRGRMLVEDLGGNVHLVLTLRPLAAILPSRWQQSIQDEYRVGYAGWLEGVFGQESGQSTRPDFWLRYDLAGHLRRWGPVVGEKNITFVMLDPADRGMLLHSFEQLLGLPEDLLVPDSSLTNPSLPHPEIEMLAAFNRAFYTHGHTRTEYVRAVRGHSVRDFKADPEALRAGRIQTPRWAAERANAAAQAWIEAVRAGYRGSGGLGVPALPSRSALWAQAGGDELAAEQAVAAAEATAQQPTIPAPSGRWKSRLGRRPDQAH